MNTFIHGIITGLIFGSVVAVCILPMKIKDKKAFTFGMFMTGFAIGFSTAFIGTSAN